MELHAFQCKATHSDVIWSGSRVMSPITMTTSALPSAAVHQLPTVVGQPKQYAQVLNGPATTAKMTNGTHIEVKKDVSDAVQGTALMLV